MAFENGILPPGLDGAAAQLNGHTTTTTTNGTATANTSTERIQIINDQKQFTFVFSHFVAIRFVA
jgi:hypothetical protein